MQPEQKTFGMRPERMFLLFGKQIRAFVNLDESLLGQEIWQGYVKLMTANELIGEDTELLNEVINVGKIVVVGRKFKLVGG